MRPREVKRGVQGFRSLRMRELSRLRSDDFSCCKYVSMPPQTKHGLASHRLDLVHNPGFLRLLLLCQLIVPPPHVVGAGVTVERKLPVEARPVTSVESAPEGGFFESAPLLTRAEALEAVDKIQEPLAGECRLLAWIAPSRLSATCMAIARRHRRSIFLRLDLDYLQIDVRHRRGV